MAFVKGPINRKKQARNLWIGYIYDNRAWSFVRFFKKLKVISMDDMDNIIAIMNDECWQHSRELNSRSRRRQQRDFSIPDRPQSIKPTKNRRF